MRAEVVSKVGSMMSWTMVEGRLADGLPMRMYLSAQNGQLWSARMHDEEHPLDEGEFVAGLDGPVQRQDAKRSSEVLCHAAEQVKHYFGGSLLQFDLPLSLRGTPFQVRVWRELIAIPFGATRSYAQIAEVIGQPMACRAVGSANGRNHLPVIVPCHRVIAADGKLSGFTWRGRTQKTAACA